jgi:hypothetical protein
MMVFRPKTTYLSYWRVPNYPPKMPGPPKK